ncbi:MAG: adenylate/guanylate cyclase domain-containing protein [Candidatus Promineofilum sp.]|nr:adenylate/guanylate cyclase domain-containing protein [Promineifilum sp.]
MKTTVSGPLLAVPDAVRLSERAEREQLHQDLLITSSTVMALLSLLWGLIYLYTGAVTAGAIPLLYAALSFISIGYYALTGRYHLFRFTQLLVTLLFPAALMLVLGGFVNSSGVILWSLTSPVGAMLFAGRRQATGWFLAFAVLVIVAGLMDAGVLPMGIAPASPPVVDLMTTFFIMNIIGPSVVVFLLLAYSTRQRDRSRDLLLLERAKSEQLLLNVLPQSIAARLKAGEGTIAECYDEASILFADIAGFTPLSAELGVELVVELLNDIHSAFDAIVARHGLEKIRTIGDGYMVVSGVPTPRPDHAHALVDTALEMLAFVRAWPSPHADRVRHRIGINSGAIMAGVIGRAKFSYDVWGDPVNVASRMESSGLPDCIQVSERTYELIKADFICHPRGTIEIKGKGEMRTWLVEGRRKGLGIRG